MFKLRSQLMVLQDGQMRCCLQLLVIHRQQIRLGLLDVKEHLLPQLFGLFNPIKLLLIDLL